MSDRLNVISYYGSKAVLCQEIEEQLDYRNTEVYIEVFGGGGSILLNKVRHPLEIYNELDRGVYTLFKVLSQREKGMQLYYRLRNVIYSEECFYDALAVRIYYQSGRFEELGQRMKRYIKDIEKKYDDNFFRNNKKIFEHKEIPKEIKESAKWPRLNEKEIQEGKELSRLYEDFCSQVFLKDEQTALKEKIEGILSRIAPSKIEVLRKEGNNRNTVGFLVYCKEMLDDCKKDLNKLLDILEKPDELSEGVRFLEELSEVCLETDKVIERLQTLNTDSKRQFLFGGKGEELSTNERTELELELAEATFIVFNMSRDGMGKHYSSGERNQEYFDNKVDGLLEVIERLQGVIVTNYDCFDILRQGVRKAFHLENYSDRQIMMYLDPPYLKEKALKENDDIEKYNPGLVYDNGDFVYERHEELLMQLCNQLYRIAVSNYRDVTGIYDKYLNATGGWSSLEYETKTTVGGIGSDRTEVLWLNY